MRGPVDQKIYHFFEYTNFSQGTSTISQAQIDLDFTPVDRQIVIFILIVIYYSKQTLQNCRYK
jgi:hypothetical protein